MATFVIVPGAWSGGWNWQRFAPQLRAEGHTVYTPTLTGLGERVHLASPDVGLHTHVQDVANVLVYEDLRGVVLVGRRPETRDRPGHRKRGRIELEVGRRVAFVLDAADFGQIGQQLLAAREIDREAGLARRSGARD